MSPADSTLAQKLESQFCPPLDVPLVRAIISDFDIQQPDQLTAVRAALEEIKCTAVVEENTGFDPSGSGGFLSSENTDDKARTTEGTSPVTSLSNGSSSTSRTADVIDGGAHDALQGLDTLPTGEKEEYLKEMFPKESVSHVLFVLKKSNGSVERAMDELLNHTFFQESSGEYEHMVTKGIDAFAEENHVPQGRKKGKKKKAKVTSQSPEGAATTSSLTDHVPEPNRWQHSSTDIDFIASRTQIPNKTIASLYHQCGASLPKTIQVLLERQPIIDKKSIPPATLTNAAQLREDFTSLDMPQAIALISLTEPSTADAHQLAQALFTRYSDFSTPKSGGVEVIPRYAPIVLPTEEPLSPKRVTSQPAPYTPSRDQLTNAREHAFSRASASYRKGKSDPLYGGAAHYYAETARAYSKSLQEATAAEADQLVASQSGADFCDLHGISVRDGTRIATERVANWWHNLGEGRIESNGWKVGQGYRIVVGIGRHSKDGKARLGPAVVKALMGRGWKVEMAGGEVLVKGAAKRK